MNESLMDNKSLILDLIEWVATAPRPYPEVMDAWRTSCPRLSIWEDTTGFGFVACAIAEGRTVVIATAAGLALLRSERPHLNN